MADKQLVAFTLADGTNFLVEVDRQPVKSSEQLPVSRVSGVDVSTVTKTFDDALNEIKPVIATVVSKLKDISPDETEIKFGIKLRELNRMIDPIMREDNLSVHLTSCVQNLSLNSRKT
jgi:hypothetical protein